MKLLAEIDQANIVQRVLVVSDEQENPEEYMAKGFGGKWIEVAQDGGKMTANMGYLYRPDDKGFQPPRPFVSWSFNDDSWQWEAPVPMPADDDFYYWDEQDTAWKKMDVED
jgi:hypothetical protein